MYLIVSDDAEYPYLYREEALKCSGVMIEDIGGLSNLCV